MVNSSRAKSPQWILHAYDRHLRQVVGLAPKTRRGQWRDLSGFLSSVGILRVQHLAALTPLILVKYVTGQSTRYKPVSLRIVASSLRQFLRFARQRGWVRQNLDSAVPKIACGARNDLPVYLSQQQLESLLTALDSNPAAGARDLAIGLCLAKLGMRAGEVTALRLEDIDWRRGTLRIVHSKNGSSAQLPLPAEVGRAIAGYLRQGRPISSHRQVFLLAPGARGMSSQAISQIIRQGLQRCQIEVPRAGAHLLRHTFASHLVQKGASLKEVADLLRHRDLNSTSIYAHVDIPNLRKLAQPWSTEATL